MVRQAAFLSKAMVKLRGKLTKLLFGKDFFFLPVD